MEAPLTALEAAWYNEVLPGSLAMAPLEESSWLPTYEAAADLAGVGLPVVDLGCGTGRFAELLRRRGLTSYAGMDFAEDVVAEAARYCQAPGFSFHVADLRDPLPAHPAPCTYVVLEVLEHLDDDRGLLAKLRPGMPVVLSVPDFDSESHVRTFPSVAAAASRYGDLLNFKWWQTHTFPSTGNSIHVILADKL